MITYDSMKMKIAHKFNIKELFKFSAASIVMLMFISLYTIVDGMFVANFAPEAFPAINIVFPVSACISAIGFMFSGGALAVVSKLLGEGKKNEAKQVFTFILVAAVVIQVVIIVCTLIFREPILKFLGADESIMHDASLYYIILISGSPLLLMEAYFHNFLIADGKPVLGMILTICAGLTNIILDYLFIAVLDMGIMGAGIATITGQAVVAVPALIMFIIKKKGIRFRLPCKLYINELIRSIYNGSSEFATNIATAVMTFSYNFIMLNILMEGYDGVSAIAGMQYTQFLFTSAFGGFAIGVSPIISYHLGEGNFDYVRKCLKDCLKIVAIGAVSMCILAYSLSIPITMLFSNGDADISSIMSYGFLFLPITFLFSGFSIMATTGYTALNDGLRSLIISSCRTFIFNVGLSFLCSFWFGITGLWIAFITAETLSILVVIIVTIIKKNNALYFKEKEKDNNVVNIDTIVDIM